MSVLKPDALSANRAGLTAGLNAQTLYRAMYDGNDLSAAVSFLALVTADEHLEDHEQATGRRSKVRRITVRPLEAITDMRLGDVVTYNDVEFIVIAIGGTDTQRWTCEDRDTMGYQRGDHFRREGRE